MRAIVLTYDVQAVIARLLYIEYMRLWPNCPLTFRVPFNEETASHAAWMSSCRNVELVRSSPGIRETMTALLQVVDDDEWVYWCIDDRVPVKIDHVAVEDVLNECEQGLGREFAMLKIEPFVVTGRNRHPLTDRQYEGGVSPVGVGGRTFHLQQVASAPYAFWNHGFCRAGILRRVFVHNGLPDGYSVKDAQTGLKAMSSARDPALGGMWLAEAALVELTETVVGRGRSRIPRLCEAARRMLKMYSLPVPQFKPGDTEEDDSRMP